MAPKRFPKGGKKISLEQFAAEYHTAAPPPVPRIPWFGAGSKPDRSDPNFPTEAKAVIQLTTANQKLSADLQNVITTSLTKKSKVSTDESRGLFASAQTSAQALGTIKPLLVLITAYAIEVLPLITHLAGNFNQPKAEGRATGDYHDGLALSQAQFNDPDSLCLIPSYRSEEDDKQTEPALLIVDEHNSMVRRLGLTTGLVCSYAGSGVSGFVMSAQPQQTAEMCEFYCPVSITAHPLYPFLTYVGESNAVRCLDDRSGRVSYLVADRAARGAEDQPALLLASASSLSVDAERSKIYVTDSGAWVIRSIDITPLPSSADQKAAAIEAASVGPRPIEIIAGYGRCTRNSDGKTALSSAFRYPKCCALHKSILYVGCESAIRTVNVQTMTVGTVHVNDPDVLGTDYQLNQISITRSGLLVFACTDGVYTLDPSTGRINEIVQAQSRCNASHRANSIHPPTGKVGRAHGCVLSSDERFVYISDEYHAIRRISLPEHLISSQS